MAEDMDLLFEDYAARYARGERPDARAYLARAGEGADELGALIERWLLAAPAPAPDEDSVALAAAWIGGQSPLLELRTRRGLKPDAVVDALVRTLGLDPAKRGKVKRYLHELETGQLDASRVDRRVWDAVAETLKGRAADLASWRPRRLPAIQAASFRMVSYSALESAAAPAAAAGAPPPPREEPDEIDRLFKGA